MTPKLTDVGKNLLLRALTGETIKFTKVQIGNGDAQDATEATALSNPLLTAQISKMEITGQYVTLSVSFNNAAVESGFRITEIGFYVENPDSAGGDVLYALGNESVGEADYVPDSTNRVLEMQLEALIFIGDTENIAAVINESLVYATAAEFAAHTSDSDNPHKVTAEQIDLGNVPNVATSDQTPTFTETETLANIASGEKLSVLFGKIKKVISSFITHLADFKNPHKVTAEQAGAAAEAHTHSTADIISGVLGVQRGGTGVSSLSALSSDLIACGTFIGDSINGRTIDLGFQPRAVYLANSRGETAVYNATDAAVFHYGGLAIRGAGLFATDNTPILTLSDNGFMVYFRIVSGVYSNVQGSKYNYIAIK